MQADCFAARFPFAAIDRVMALESTDGFVRVGARCDKHRIVGWQALGEAVQEAALRALGHALHI